MIKPMMSDADKRLSKRVALVLEGYRTFAAKLATCDCGNPDHDCTVETGRLLEVITEALVPYITDSENKEKLENTLIMAIVGSFMTAELLTTNFALNKDVDEENRRDMMLTMADHFIDFGEVMKLRAAGADQRGGLSKFTAEELQQAVRNIVEGKTGSLRRRNEN